MIIWTEVEFYLHKRNKRAASIYCHQVINDYPKSQYAEKARAKLVELGPEYASGAIFLKNTDPQNPNLLIRVLETPPTYRLKKYPMIGSPRDTSSGSGMSTKSNGGKKPADSSKSDDDATGRARKKVTDEPPDEVEQEPAAEPEPAPKPRRRRPNSASTPDELPPGADEEAQRVNPSPVGRARL